MKKLIIITIITLSFSSVSPSLAAEMSASLDASTNQVSVPNVLPQSENVLNVLPVSMDVQPTPVIETAVEPTTVSVPEVLPIPLPSPLPSGHVPTVVTVFESSEETITVTPPCSATCPNPPSVIVPVGAVKIIPCRDVVVPAIEADVTIPQADRLVLPETPCPSITPIIQVTSTGGGGGSIVFPTNVLPDNEPVLEETSIEVPGQKVLGEQSIVVENTTSPSFPKTGAAPVAPSTSSTSTTPSNTSNALMSFSYSNDRKREYSIA